GQPLDVRHQDELAALVARHAGVLSLTLSLAWPAAERWLAPLGSPAAQEELVLEVAGRTLRADLYRPAAPRGVLVLIHGLSSSGRRQPDLARLARLIAERGQLVLVPHIEGLARFRLGGAEVEDIRVAAGYARRRWDTVGLAGFSFGAGPVLLAAADIPDLRVVASFGGYADLRHVVSFVTTGVHGWEGQRHVERQEPYNRWKLLSLLAGFVGSEPDGVRLEEIAARRLADPADDTSPLEARLDTEGRAVLALVMNEREDAVEGLLAALPLHARQALERLSPLSAVGRIRAPLLIAHGARDPSIPYTESLRLAAAAGRQARLTIFETFHHTGPPSGGISLAAGMADGSRLLRLVDDLLSHR
ncbi:MAG: alpha/beta hydrolase family protein, partial [Candidatus Rokuibacteriota bacterium]